MDVLLFCFVPFVPTLTYSIFSDPTIIVTAYSKTKTLLLFLPSAAKKKQMMQSAGGQTLSANPPESRTEPAGPSHDEMIGFSVSPANEQ